MTIAARYRSTGDVKVPPACAYHGLDRNCRMRSIFGRSGIVLGRPALLGAIQAPALLDMARMCGNSGIGHTKKAVGYNAGHFEAVEVVKSHLRENPVQGVLDLGRSRGAKEHHLYFCRHEKEVPPRGMDLAIEGETIESTDYAPFSRAGFTLQFKEFRDPRALFDQNRSDF